MILANNPVLSAHRYEHKPVNVTKRQFTNSVIGAMVTDSDQGSYGPPVIVSLSSQALDVLQGVKA